MRCLFVVIWYIFFFCFVFPWFVGQCEVFEIVFVGQCEVFVCRVGQCEVFVCRDLVHFFFVLFSLGREAHRSANEVPIL